MSYKTFILEKELGYCINELTGLQWMERMRMLDRYSEESQERSKQLKTKKK